MHKTILYLIIAIIQSSLMNAQDLSQHQWKNRLLLVLTDDTNNAVFQNQIKVLESQKTGLEDRKLIIYQITPTHFKKGISTDSDWMKRPELYQDLATSDKAFEVRLIGLDGGTKLQQNTVLTAQTLFNTIDAMPMRRAEIGRN